VPWSSNFREICPSKLYAESGNPVVPPVAGFEVFSESSLRGGQPFLDILNNVVILCYLFIALGTMAGGWRIVKTLGTKITKLQPVGGFCAETAAAISIIGASLGGIPVSTTHTITGAVMGVGATRRLTAVR
jgi:hypothetical protein